MGLFSDGLSKCLESILAKGTSITFAFPETAFTTVTAYQNQQVIFLLNLLELRKYICIYIVQFFL